MRYEYDVFGAVRSEIGSSDNARKFTGKEYDADVKLYYYSARYYDPYIGRFTSRDPVGQGLNWYVYTANNPLKFVDPTGRTIQIVGSDGTIEVTISRGDKKDFHGGSVDTLSPQAKAIYLGLEGIPDQPPGQSHPALKNTKAVGGMYKDLVDSDKVAMIFFSRGSYPSELSGDTFFIDAEGPSDDFVGVRINEKYADGNFLTLRTTLVHELTHASQAFKNPTAFRDKSYYNVYSFEFGAFDTQARFAAELGGLYIKNTPYVPRPLLTRQSFGPLYNSFIHGAVLTQMSLYR